MPRKLLYWLFVFPAALALACSLSGQDQTAAPGAAATLPPETAVATLAPDIPLGEATQAVIGAAGGTLKSSDSGLQLTIPAGALAADTTIAVQPIRADEPGDTGLAYRLTPEKQVFSEPVTITFTLSDEQLQGSAVDMIGVVFQHDDGSWEDVPVSSVDEDAKTVSVQVSHFTKFKNRYEYRLDPLDTTVLTDSTVGFEVHKFVYDKQGAVKIAPVPSGGLEKWTVNGIEGGNSSLGTISAGLYKAPAKAPKPNLVTVQVQLKVSGVLKKLPAQVLIVPRRWTLTISQYYQQDCLPQASGAQGGSLSIAFRSLREQYVDFTLEDNFEAPQASFAIKTPVLQVNNFKSCDSRLKITGTPALPDNAIDIQSFKAALDRQTGKFTFSMTGTWTDTPTFSGVATINGDQVVIPVYRGQTIPLDSNPFMLDAKDGTTKIVNFPAPTAGATFTTTYILDENTGP